jgi:hypothetical protein
MGSDTRKSLRVEVLVELNGEATTSQVGTVGCSLDPKRFHLIQLFGWLTRQYARAYAMQHKAQ